MPINIEPEDLTPVSESISSYISSVEMLDSLADLSSQKELMFQFNIYSIVEGERAEIPDDDDEDESDYDADTSDIMALDDHEKKQVLEFIRTLYKRRVATAKIALTKAGINITD